MARNISDSRLGRAVMAGVPVALAIFGAELLDGDWALDRGDDGIALSWTSADDGRVVQGLPTLRLTTCLGDGCGRWSVAVSLPDSHLTTDVTSFARSMVSAVTGDCPDEAPRNRPLASA